MLHADKLHSRSTRHRIRVMLRSKDIRNKDTHSKVIRNKDIRNKAILSKPHIHSKVTISNLSNRPLSMPSQLRSSRLRMATISFRSLR